MIPDAKSAIAAIMTAATPISLTGQPAGAGTRGRGPLWRAACAARRAASAGDGAGPPPRVGQTAIALDPDRVTWFFFLHEPEDNVVEIYHA